MVILQLRCAAAVELDVAHSAARVIVAGAEDRGPRVVHLVEGKRTV